ncbi:beta-ketoacyl synthase N-terminal-like domain-containing protein [Streptosporangium sp. NPDC002721]|uniref:beta-ketoacyl synthase N-terminal-like domain-containing protein n=1 Tax=Streptosporangium sp. NPDC002721 TaxID=3366188 RepID=UPI0036A20666
MIFPEPGGGPTSGRRAVITGIGVVAPTGVGVAEHWEESLTGRSRIGPVTSFDAAGAPIRLAGEVAGFDEREFVDSKLLVQTDRWTWFALAATELALADAALDPAREDPFDLSVVTAGASGGNAFGQREIQALWSKGPRAVSAYQSIGWFYAASSGQLSIRHQLKGACGVLVADAAGAIDALAEAARLIRRGTEVVVTGGTEAPLSPYALACQAGEATVSRASDPAAAYRPFAPGAGGHVPGEGGAMLIVEDRHSALGRCAPTVYAEIAGTASTHDAHHVADPAPDHRQYARAMREAIARAGLGPDDVGVVFADGAGDPVRDAREVAALREVFGARRVPVTVPKTMTGRLCSGGAALDVAWAALSLANGVIPPTAGTTVVEGVDLVTEARAADGLSAALVVARGSGGFNSAAVLTAV